MIITGVDFESTSADQATLRVTEIGAVSVNTETRIQERFSSLVYSPDYPAQTPEIVDLTGITDYMLKAEGIPEKEAFDQLNVLIEKSDIIIAHNKLFDQRVYETQAARVGSQVWLKEWICTYVDVPYDAKFRCKQLSHLALDHGIPMDHRSLHRAVNDVELMLELFDKYDLDDVLKFARTPWIFVRAMIAKPWEDGGKGKASAQLRGYSWQTCRGTDTPVFKDAWVKRLKANDLVRETEEAPFNVVQLTEFQNAKN